MARIRRQSGEGKLGCIFWLLLLAAASLVAYKMIPVKVQSAQLHDFMVEQARFSYSRGAGQIKKSILQRARELDLPLTDKQLRVRKDRGHIRMEAQYTVPIEFPGYTYEWEFQHQVDRPIFVF
ncbi:MAG TPA: hypothetical protein VMT16_03180 [Thermoanaerobaculia bacterium]|nr:hypothetical protein [Thermoanaerobaculia bacterium]